MNSLKFFIAYTLLLSSLILLLYIAYVYLSIDAPPTVVERVISYRRTRIAVGLLAGAILGLSGSLLQGSLRNPLVDPYILGIASGALFTTYLAYLLIPRPCLATLTIASSLGGLLALALTVAVAEGIGGSDVSYVLSGIGVSSLFSGLSITIYYIMVSINPAAVQAHIMLVGSLVGSLPQYIPLLTGVAGVLLAIYLFTAKPLNAMLIGDTYALQLGYSPRRTRFITVLAAGIASSIVVVTTGIIGFIGLVAPHIARLILRTSDNRFAVPLSGLTGALLLGSTDTVSKYVIAPAYTEVPVGALVSLFGAPFFLLLLLRRFRGRGV